MLKVSDLPVIGRGKVRVFKGRMDVSERQGQIPLRVGIGSEDIKRKLALTPESDLKRLGIDVNAGILEIETFFDARYEAAESFSKISFRRKGEPEFSQRGTTDGLTPGRYRFPVSLWRLCDESKVLELDHEEALKNYKPGTAEYPILFSLLLTDYATNGNGKTRKPEDIGGLLARISLPYPLKRASEYINQVVVPAMQTLAVLYPGSADSEADSLSKIIIASICVKSQNAVWKLCADAARSLALGLINRVPEMGDKKSAISALVSEASWANLQQMGSAGLEPATSSV